MFCGKCLTVCPDDAAFCSKCASNLSIHGVGRISVSQGVEMKLDTRPQFDYGKKPAPSNGLRIGVTPAPTSELTQELAQELAQELEHAPEPEPELVLELEPEPEPKPELEPGLTPSPSLTPASSLKPMRSPVRQYLFAKSALYGIVCLISLIIIVAIAVPLIRPTTEIELSTYEELNNSLNKGKVRVKVSKDSVERITLELGINFDNPNPQQGSMSKRKHCSMVELPDGIIFLDGNHSNFPQTNDSYWLFTPGRGAGDYPVLIDQSINMLSLYGWPTNAPNRSDQIEELKRIRDNIRPIVLAPVNPGSFISSLIFLAVFITIFIAFGISLANSAMIFFSPEKSKTYRTLGKFGDPSRLLSECEKSLGSREQLASGKYVCTPDFILYPRLLSVIIAPVKELIWAYLVVYNTSGNHMHHMQHMHQWDQWAHLDNLVKPRLVLSFSTGTRIVARVRNKAAGIGELHWLKKQNPNILIGFRQNLESMFESDFDGFSEKIAMDTESMQRGVDAKDVKDVAI